MNIDKRQKLDSVLISSVHASYWASYTILSTYLVLYLNTVGYKSSQIGLFLTVSSVVGAISQPFWGYLADKYHNAKKPLLLCLLLSIPVLLLYPKISYSYLLLLIFSLILGLIERPIAGLLDSVTNIASENNSQIVYGISRGMGSFFSAVAMWWSGSYLQNKDISLIFIIVSILMIIALISLYFMKSANVQESTETISLKVVIDYLIKNKSYLIFLFINIIVNIGLRAALTYMPIMMDQLHGDVSQVGLAMAINTVGMLPVMVLYTYLYRKGWSNEHLFIIGIFFTIVRIASLIFVKSISGLLMVQIINSFSYGFLQPAMIKGISDYTDIKYRSTAITLAASMILALSSFGGDFIGGKIIDASDMKVMYTSFTVLAIIGLLMTISFFKKEK